MKQLICLVLLLASATFLFAQHSHDFNRQDTLRGSITPERAWWDLVYYDLNIEVFPKTKTIQGANTIRYTALEAEQDILQIDLQPPMAIEKVTMGNDVLTFEREGNVYWVKLPKASIKGETAEVTVYFGGKPVISKNPPWDGGLTWTKDNNGNDFIATSCQGDGASLWWPCKDHMYDEVEGMKISVTVPEHLMDVSNGRLTDVQHNRAAKTKTYHWLVENPINNYGVNINVGDYVHFDEKYKGEKGKLNCDYYVLRDNLAKAKAQFKQVPLMLEAFEYWFGPYPFYEDGYKLVEVPYLGMEHQSSVTYGNGYMNGYRGRDLSQTGIGLLFDFIIIHESGHEWFANNITYKDVADMWIHESFTAYSEGLFVEYHQGKEKGRLYTRGTRSSIQNDVPIIGTYDVNHSGSGDMYYKGANMLNTIRELAKDDAAWRALLRGLNETFYHQTVTTQQIENYMSEQIGRDLSPIFDQYLRDTRIPILEYRLDNNVLEYRWSNCVPNFDLPIKGLLNGKTITLNPSTRWGRLPNVASDAVFEIGKDYYVAVLNLMP